MSSVGKVGGSSDTMWRSENDILKDLAFLNDFKDEEPYKVLYSNGRGTKIKQKEKSSEEFIDPRTGEVIDVSESEFNCSDNWQKGKGRGRYFGNLSKKKYQLQEQLRLARPLGSGDEAIESFCRRFKLEEAPSTAECASTSDSDVSKPTGRIIGCRNSGLQSNVLINGLLSKGKDLSSTGGVVTNEKNLSSAEDSDEKSKSDDNSNMSVTSSSIFSEQDFPPLCTQSSTLSREHF